MSMNASVLKAKACLAKATPIPGHPLFNMTKVALLHSQSDFDLLQNAIDYLACKAKAKMDFTDEEKTFLKDVFTDLSLGGTMKGYPEAAKLISHYVNGKGERFQIDAAVYRNSVIVKDTSEAVKDYVRQLIAQKKYFLIVNSSDRTFLMSRQAHRVARIAGRDVQRQGYLLDDGNLLAEQSNARLKNANNRFILVARNTLRDSKTVSTRWSVDDRYKFEPFEKSDFYTNIPFSDSQVLKILDGLSQYMTKLKIADEFDYWAAWTEAWNV